MVLKIRSLILLLFVSMLFSSVVLIPTCCATTGTVIIFERENWQGPLDVGHVGIAIQLDDGTWIAGAIEGPGGWAALKGTDDYNGGWSYVFETEEDVINEFNRDRKEPLSDTESGNIEPHKSYDQMKKITVQERDESDYAEIVIKDFSNGGFSVWTDRDCFTKVYDVMKAYGVDETILGSREGIISPRWPKAFFDALPGDAENLDDYSPSDSSETTSQSTTPILTATTPTTTNNIKNGAYVLPSAAVDTVLLDTISTPLLPPPDFDAPSDEGASGSDISDVGSLTPEQMDALIEQMQALGKTIEEYQEYLDTQVKVNIWVHIRNRLLPAEGTYVVAIDGAGNEIRVELDSDGKAIVYGAPGVWRIMSYGGGRYVAHGWSKEIPVGSVGDCELKQMPLPGWEEISAGVGTLV